MTPIETLLNLADRFPVIKRVDYDNNEHREFCNQVLLAVKAAAPDIRKLADQSGATGGETANHCIPESANEIARALSTIPEAQRISVDGTQAISAKEEPIIVNLAPKRGRRPGRKSRQQ